MVITERFEKELNQRGYNNLRLWRLGVDTELFSRNPNSSVIEKYNFPPPIFVYFGRIAKEKNIEEFLRLHLPGTKLVIGDGPEKKSLESKYGKDTVFLGYKKGQELVDFLSASSVFVFPSLTDTFPLAIIEAFSCGLPVAAHDVMGLSDLVVKGVGYLDKNLEEAAIKCLKLSPEECREYALKFSWEQSIKSFSKNLVKT
jgi:glycosyltransferase involved in cell wall biosynthesis